MKNGNATDGTGIVAEMIKVGGEKKFEILANLFNDIILHQAVPPREWKET